MTLAEQLLALAIARGATLATAESCTGGLVAAAITDVAGSSAAFDRGFVTYTNQAKTDLLGVPPALIAAHGAVSEEVARAMAQGARSRAGVTLAVAITGIAGPGGSEFKPEGRVCFGLATADGTRTETIEFGALGRALVRRAATDHALRLLIRGLA
jgi:nicotinamide-nucleotide amidase